MDILMLGHSGAGKTTFMAGLYAVMKTGKVGYNIDCNFVHIPADTRSAFPVISVQSPVSIQCCWQS